jgi:hypothetical protein
MLPPECVVRQSRTVGVLRCPSYEVLGQFSRARRRPEGTQGVDRFEDDRILLHVHFIARVRPDMLKHIRWQMEVTFLVDFNNAAGHD